MNQLLFLVMSILFAGLVFWGPSLSLVLAAVSVFSLINSNQQRTKPSSECFQIFKSIALENPWGVIGPVPAAINPTMNKRHANFRAAIFEEMDAFG